MKISEVLKACKKHLAKNWGEACREYNKPKYICYAINRCEDVPEWDKRQARNYVLKQLDGCYTLEEWLAVKHNTSMLFSKVELDKLQETRRAWLKHMIKQLRKEGR